MNISNFLGRFQGVRAHGNGQFSARCPCEGHDDKKSSLSIKKEDNGNIKIYCHSGCDYRNVLTAVGLTVQDLYAEQYSSNVVQPNAWERIAEYEYSQTLKKIRWLVNGEKTFTWEHKQNPSDSLWQKGANGQFYPLYNQSVLATVKPDDTVYIVEGEKDVDLLTVYGRLAICSPHGATAGNPNGKWVQAYSDTLTGFNVAIIQDNDTTGKVYARTVATCLQGVAKSVRVVDLTVKWNDLKEHGDISDVFEMSVNDPKVFDTLDELTAMAPMATTVLMDSMTEKFRPADYVPLQTETTSTEYTTYKGRELISAQDLQRANLPPVKYLIEGILAVGTSIISAASKIGKSWFVLSLGIAVADGEMFWERQTEKCGVLYLALEDTYNRLQDRLNKVLNGKPAPEQFYFLTDVPNLDNGLLGVLDDYLRQHPEIGLIIVDTLQKIRGRGSSGSQYQADYLEMGMLKRFVDDRNISVLFVHHNRKTEDKGDPYNMISGSVGIMGAADSVFVITKESRNAQNATLHIVGRDVEQSRLLIRFNKNIYQWELVGDVAERAKTVYDNNPIVKTIKSLLDESPDRRWSGTATKLLEDGKRITGSFIATTAQKLGYELIKLNDQLYEHDKISYEPTRNGNAGQIHNFSYAEVIEPTEVVEPKQDEGKADENDYSNLEW